MHILNRFRQTRPVPENKIVMPELTKAEPITPIPEPPEPETRLVQKCAHCGENEAVHAINVGWFYLGRLPYVSVCEACYAVAKQREVQHHLSQKKTVLEHPVVPARPRVRTRVERRKETESMRKPSRPLEDFTLNLATQNRL